MIPKNKPQQAHLTRNSRMTSAYVTASVLCCITYLTTAELHPILPSIEIEISVNILQPQKCGYSALEIAIVTPGTAIQENLQDMFSYL